MDQAADCLETNGGETPNHDIKAGYPTIWNDPRKPENITQVVTNEQPNDSPSAERTR